MNVVLMGPPGSGKGTQAQYFVSKKSFKHLSTGDIFRKALKEKTSLGQKVQFYLDAGKLVSDQITVDLVDEVLKKVGLDTSLLFDGFPRTLVQAKDLDKMLSKKNQKVDLAVSLKIPDSAVLDRLTGRRWAPQSASIYHIRNNPPKKEGFCDKTGEPLLIRKDDKEEVVKNRLEIFHKQNNLLRAHYESQGVLKDISAEGSPQEIFERILRFIDG